jgi:hypothetical protein
MCGASITSNQIGMIMGRVGDGFCPPQIQTHKVRVFLYPSQFSTGMKIKNSNPYSTGFRYPYSVISPYEFELHFDIFFIKKELKVENYYFLIIFIQRKYIG